MGGVSPQLGIDDSSPTTRFLFDLFSALLLWVIALIGAWLPKTLSKNDSAGTKMAYSLGNMLSAGVMLSAGFVHLLGEALADLRDIEYPLAPFLCACGYCITLLADTAVELVAGGRGHECCESEILAELAEGRFAANGDAPHPPPARLGTGARSRVSADLRPGSNGALHGSYASDLEALDSEQDSGALLLHTSACASDKCAHGKPAGIAPSAPKGGAPAPGGHKPVSFITAIFLAAALSLHSVLEGMALGAQAHITASEDILVAIAAHKGLAAYALGSSVIDSRPSDRRFWTVIASFSLATPVGIFMGYALAELTSPATGAALSALASGTFIYVATMEVIPKELGNPDYKVGKMGMLLLGFGAMSLLAIWA